MADTQARVSGTVVGYFENYSDAQEAVSRLKDAGFQANQIGLAARSGEDFDSGSRTGSTTGSTTGSHVSSAAHKVGEKTEGVWDKVKNFFEGGAVEPYADEKRSGDLANREITSTGTSDTNYGYEAGSDDFRNTLSGLSVPEQHSRYFGHRFENSQNGAVVTVSASGRESEAESILEQCGGDLGSNAADYDYSADQSTAAGATTGATTTENQRIQLLGEVLRVHKERIERGEVRIRKEVVTEQQTVQVPVSREELVIERVAVAGSTPASGQIGDTGEIRIPLTEERASLDKQTVVREEVAVGKRAVEGTRTVGGDVRHEELVVDDKTKTRATTDTETDVDNPTDRNYNR